MAFETKRHADFKIFKVRSQMLSTNKKNLLTTKD
ncbi:hypothetical protein HPSAT_05665 [Helicobacter pylori Sat464]|nr:hypothetical protein HPSAT_05665 [Helicobacter pylori Sat464]